MPAGAAAVLLAPDARRMPVAELLDALIRALREGDGILIDRASCSLPMLHPEVRSTQLIWEPGAGARAIPRTYDPATAAMYARSPMFPLYTGAADVIRHRIDPSDASRPYDILNELAGQGFTDYLAAVARSDNPWERAPTSWATRTPGGFTEAQVGSLLALMPLLGLVLTNYAQRASTRALLGTYLGSDAASRVLDGHIRRGAIVDVEAAVCFCDLRNFTELSQQLDQAALIELLDDAFGAVVGAVESERGDVLKFIGDAVLAVFRVDGDESARVDAVTRAFRAACGALERAALLHQQRLADGKAPLVIGLSLHLGHVAYGNIGSPTRLDFTVIGAAVNLASRLEGLCRTLGYPIVMSDAVASRLGAATLVDAGNHNLKGIPDPVHVWGVTLDAAAKLASATTGS
jgi:adenylate cyclase